MSEPRSHIEALWGDDDSNFQYDPDTLPESRRDHLPTHPHDYDEIDELAADPAVDHAPAVRGHGKIKAVLEMLDSLETERGEG
ncbi:MAG: hypothetical protein ACSHX9_02140 [Luteolibacter sp.]